MKLKIILRTALTVYLFSLFIFSAIIPASSFALDLGKPLSGDSRCGGIVNGTAVPCPTDKIFPLLRDISIYAIIIIAGVALASIIWAVGRGLVAQNQPEKLQALSKQLGVITVNLLIAILLIGGLATAFWDAFVKPEYQAIFDKWLSFVNEVPIWGPTQVYAQTASSVSLPLPNPLVVNSVWDVLLLLFQLSMRWIAIPVLIGSWVWAGFLFVQAQGNPEKIKYARERLWYSFVSTLILMFALGIAFAFRNTFNQIFT